jgi:hypothetical protein
MDRSTKSLENARDACQASQRLSPSPRERERESNLAPGVDDLRNVEFLLGNLEALAENLGFGVCVERAVVLWC